VKLLFKEDAMKSKSLDSGHGRTLWSWKKGTRLHKEIHQGGR